MRQFKDFGIKPKETGFSGDKIKITKILNKEISVLDYKLKDSKFKKENTEKCLCLQIEFNDEKRIVFTGSLILQECIEQVPKDNFPFKTIIIQEDERYLFT